MTSVRVRRFSRFALLLLCAAPPAACERVPDGTGRAAALAESVAPAPAEPAAPVIAEPGPVVTEERMRLGKHVVTVEKQVLDSANFHRTYWLKVDGRAVLEDNLVYGLHVHGTYATPARHLALVAAGLEGTACPVRWQVLELREDRPPHLSEELDDCPDAPSSVSADAAGRLRMTFSVYLPARVFTQDVDYPDPPPATWVYHPGGRLERVGGGR